MSNRVHEFFFLGEAYPACILDVQNDVLLFFVNK